MTTKTEMTLENVKAKDGLTYIGGESSYFTFNQTYYVGQDDKGLYVVNDFKNRIGLHTLTLNEYRHLSAPESQAHLLTEKDSNDMAHVSEHLSAIEYLRQPSLKELSQPPVMEGKEEKITYQTTLTDKELINLCDEWVSKMCKTGGKAFTMSVPVRLNYDTDVVLSALINRFSLANKTIQSLQSEVEQLKGLLKEAQPFCGTMLRGKIEHYTSK